MALLTSSWKMDLVTLLVAAVTILYLFAKRQYSYWDRKGFPTLPGFNYLLGHFTKCVYGVPFADLMTTLYNSTHEKFIGIYSIFRPILFVRDPELVRTILIKDFNHFTDRGMYSDEKNDPLSGHLFALPGLKWRNLRSKLTPTFTSGKLKAMFSTVLNCGATLQCHLDKLADKSEMLDVREISAANATNVIASVAFGIDVDSINNPNNDFRVAGRNFFATTFANGFRLLLLFLSPTLVSILRIGICSRDIEKFIMSVVKENLEYREKNNVSRKDFFQLLIQLRNTGTVQLDDQWDTVIKADENQKTLTIDEMAAQTFVFFLAGFETSSTTLSFCLYELAKHQEIQKRVQDEIDKVLAENDGKITYDSIAEMKYLEACIDETLRMYPIVQMINRTCVKDYRIPGTDKTIEKGVEVFISAFSLMRDEKYYPHPNEFKPERFGEEGSAGKNLIDRPYIPFGDGPRNCIGMRLGKLQTKVGLLLMLQKHSFDLDEKLKRNGMKFDPKTILLAPLGGIHLHVKKR